MNMKDMIQLTKGGKNMVNAILAAVLSFFIPGLGQALAGDLKKGAIFFIIFLIFALIIWFVTQSLIVNIISLIFCLYAAYDAYQMAQ